MELNTLPIKYPVCWYLKLLQLRFFVFDIRLKFYSKGKRTCMRKKNNGGIHYQGRTGKRKKRMKPT
jgi:hypothetical protein